MNLRILQTKTWTAYKSKQQKKLKKKKIRYFGSCLLWVMSTKISVNIAVDIAVDSRSILGRHSVDSRSILGRQSVDTRSRLGRQSVDIAVDRRLIVGR